MRMNYIRLVVYKGENMRLRDIVLFKSSFCQADTNQEGIS
jgi:hypothetical protein